MNQACRDSIGVDGSYFKEYTNEKCDSSYSNAKALCPTPSENKQSSGAANAVPTMAALASIALVLPMGGQ